MKILNSEGIEVEEIDFGIVEAGNNKTIKAFLYNDTDAQIIDIAVDIANAEVKINNYPRNLMARKSGEIELTWTPSITLKRGLRTKVNVKGTELWR